MTSAARSGHSNSRRWIADHRVYLVGDEQEYQLGGGLTSVLRDPIVKAMAAQEFEEHDEQEKQDDLQWK
jgi:hypothetical protein